MKRYFFFKTAEKSVAVMMVLEGTQSHLPSFLVSSMRLACPVGLGTIKASRQGTSWIMNTS